MPHRLIIQLARLGDFLQSLPAIAALKVEHPEDRIDLLCATPLVLLGDFFPTLGKVFPWDGDEWSHIAKSWSEKGGNPLTRAAECINQFQIDSYLVAYNLNNHPRAMIAAHLLAKRVIGPGCYGPLSSTVPGWVNYVKLVGEHRGGNRVHLADALCGVCGVKPPHVIPTLQLQNVELPIKMSGFFVGAGIRVALVLGSGDPDRRIPLHIWEQWIRTFLSACPEGRVMLVGGSGERVLSHNLLDRIPSLLVGRIWDACGHTSLPQLANILKQCDWVIGSDTGPLHLGVACGAKAQGFYFSRARVHETGPYGSGHWVWQAESPVKGEAFETRCSKQDPTQNIKNGVRPEYWPVKESVELLLTETCSCIPSGWSLWSSHRDAWGAHFSQYTDPYVESDGYREQIWDKLHAKEQVDWDSVMELMSMSGSS